MQGTLIYDKKTERFDIRYDLTTYYGGLHCGDCLDVFVNGRWVPTRIEMSDKWYLVGIDTEDIAGLRAVSYTHLDVYKRQIIGIVKVDSETGDIVRLAGATFKIKNLDTDEYVGFWVYGDLLGKYVTEFTTNEDGNIMTPDSVRAGHYQIEEIKAPNGMLLSKESKPFTITDDGAHQIGPDVYKRQSLTLAIIPIGKS